MITGWYTFGNHFHWVDMEWLWGPGVLGRSIEDMMSLIERTGARGNINFDGIGYEKLAAEDPHALDVLRKAIAGGVVEVVGATYGQPYALFHGGESAVRQLGYGVRAATRLLGIRPRAFWEEEFCFFPQLPQLLTDAGYQSASLFFQWTWHTPEIPVETAPAVRWRGVDGSEIVTLTRNSFNLHQWPEDVAAMLERGDLQSVETPVVQQWLELLPSPDWMCRSELVAPGVEMLLHHDDVTLQPGTLSEVAAAVAPLAPVREYTMDDVFHGMSIGKNGSRLHRMSREMEQTALTAEALAVAAGTLGRPYAQWGKYPAWELEEVWRELLAFQHHDNDECEGLCGHIGYLGAERGRELARSVLERTARHIRGRVFPAAADVCVNPLGWERDVEMRGEVIRLGAFEAIAVPPPGSGLDTSRRVSVVRDGDELRLSRGAFEVVVDAATGSVLAIGDVRLRDDGLGPMSWVKDAAAQEFAVTEVAASDESIRVRREAGSAHVALELRLAGEIDALDIELTGELGTGPDPRAHAALTWALSPDLEMVHLYADTPYAVGEVTGRNRWHRKYPTGDWMTSPQELEEVVDSFTGLQLVDLVDGDGGGLLWMHDGSQGFHRIDDGIAVVLSMRDPWDGDHYDPALAARFRLLPHGPISHTTRWKRAQEFSRPVIRVTSPDVAGDGGIEATPARWRPVRLSSDDNVVVTALYRESAAHAAGIDGHVVAASAEAVLVRLVELDGLTGRARIEADGMIARAWACTLMGEVRSALPVRDGGIDIVLEPHKIRTVAIELTPAPGDDRTLDQDRAIWATAHRIEEGEI